LYYIDLSNNINLKKLKLSKNYLPHVDLTNNINLEEIYINNIRQLFDVELGQKPKLKIFSIKRTDYEYENDIEYLDLSGVNASADIEIDGSPIKKMKTSNEIDYTGKEYLMYENDLEFKLTIDQIYNKYKNGEDIYLQCFCKPLECHGDFIKEFLEKKLIKEKMMERKKAQSR
jgi:hypothetical protein